MGACWKIRESYSAKEVLNVPCPADQLAPAAATISRYMDVIRHARSAEQLLNTGVSYKRGKARLDTTAVLTEVMSGPKRSWMTAVERTADEKYPTWRELFQRSNRKTAYEIRAELEPRSAWRPQRHIFTKALLEWLEVEAGPEVIVDISAKLDAVLEFTIFVTREFLLRNYSPEKHQSDVFDQFQLQYLAMDRFVIVSADPDLTKRTQRSSQADRIMQFDDFLETLRR